MEKNVIQIINWITIKIDSSLKNIIKVKKNYIWNRSTCSCKNGIYLACIIDNSIITYDEIIDAEAKAYPK